MAAAITKAQVRHDAVGLARVHGEPQRGHLPSCSAGTQTRPQASQPTAPGRKSSGAIAGIGAWVWPRRSISSHTASGIERGVGPHDDDGEQAQRIDGGAELDRDQVAELGVGHEHAEQQHLEHRPGAHAARHQEDAAQVGRQPAHLEADQHVERAGELDDRRDRGGEGDRQRQRPQAAIDQLDRSRDSSVVSCTMPAVETFISMASHSTANSTRAAQVSARWRFSGSARVRRSAVPQRTQSERMSGPSAGTIWNRPQPRHSRSCGRVTGSAGLQWRRIMIRARRGRPRSPEKSRRITAAAAPQCRRRARPRRR